MSAEQVFATANLEAIANPAMANSDVVGVTASFDSSRELSARFAEDVAEVVSKPRGNVAQLKTQEAIGATVVSLRAPQVSPERIRVETPVGQATLQRWYGEVLSVGAEHFHARLEPASGLGGPSEIADFPLEMVTTDDRQLLKVGASFSYAVFSESQRAGRKTSMALVFRRSGVPIKARIRSAEERAERWMTYFEGND